MLRILRAHFGCFCLLLCVTGDGTRQCAAAPPTYRSLSQAYKIHHPTAWWRLDEDSGEVAEDQHGDQNGRYFVQGGVRFDGDDYVDLGTVDISHEQFTIAARFKAVGFSVPDSRLISKAVGLSAEEDYWTLSAVAVDDQPRLRFRLTTDQGPQEATAKAEVIPYDQWIFVAAVYDGRRMTLYQDGQAVASVAHQGRAKTNAECHAWIGDSPAGQGSRPFEGEIREVAIFPQALSATTLEAMFQSMEGQGDSQPPLTELPSPPRNQSVGGSASPSSSDFRASPTPSVVSTSPAISLPPLPPLGACPHCGGFHSFAPIVRVQPRPLPAAARPMDFLLYCDG